MVTSTNRGQEKGQFTPEEIQLAKDFIWEYLEQHTKELLVNMVTTDNLEKNSLVTDKIVIGFEYK